MQIQHQCNGCGSIFPVSVDINEGDRRPCPCPRCHKRFDLIMKNDKARIVEYHESEPERKPKKKRKRRKPTFKEKVESK